MRKPRFTAVPNEVVDIHLPNLSGAELKILLVIIRSTFGWNREVAAISLPALAEKSGLSRSTVIDTIKSLQAKGLVSKETQSTGDGSHAANKYEPLFDDEVVLKSDYPPSENQVGGSPEIGRGWSENQDYYKEERKEPLNNIQQANNILPDPVEEKLNADSYLRKASTLKGRTYTGKQKSIIRERWLDEWCEMSFEDARPLVDQMLNKPQRTQTLYALQKREYVPQSSRNGRAVATDYAWREDPGFMKFRENHMSVDDQAIESDWGKAWPFWQSCSPEERQKAIERILTCTAPFVKLPQNYLREKVFERPPRAKRETKSAGDLYREDLLKKIEEKKNAN